MGNSSEPDRGVAPEDPATTVPAIIPSSAFRRPSPPKPPPPRDLSLKSAASNLPAPRHEGAFCGREAELAELERLLSTGGRAAVLAEKPGLGGSELAAEYGRRRRGRHGLCWRISAGSAARLNAGLAALADAAWPEEFDGAAAPQRSRRRWAVDWLRAQPGWLLLVDDVEDAETVVPLLDELRPGDGAIVLTTRRRLEVDVPRLRLDDLDAAETLAALRRLSGAGRRLGPSMFDELAAATEGRPSAIQQAAALLRHDEAEPANRLRELVSAPVPRRGDFDPASRSLRAGMAAADSRSAGAADLLRRLATLSPAPVPRAAATDLAPGDADRQLAALSDFHLVDDEGDQVRLPRACGLLGFADRERIQDTRSALARGLPASDPEVDVTAWPEWERLIPHLLAVATDPSDVDVDSDELAAQGFARAAAYLNAQEDPEAARVLARTAGAIAPAETEAAAVAANQLASALDALGRHDRALSLARRAAELTQTLRGTQHPDLAYRFWDLAATLSRSGRTDEAVDRALNALYIATFALGHEHPFAKHVRLWISRTLG